MCISRKELNYQTGNYVIKVWSGGKAIQTYKVKDVLIYALVEVNGWGFPVNGRMVYVTGTVTIEPL